MTAENKCFVSLLETILQIRTSAAASRQESRGRIVELTDENDTLFVAFIPVTAPP